MSRFWPASVVVSIGVACWALRVASGKPHAIMIGIAGAAIAAAFCAFVVWVADAS